MCRWCFAAKSPAHTRFVASGDFVSNTFAVDRSCFAFNYLLHAEGARFYQAALLQDDTQTKASSSLLEQTGKDSVLYRIRSLRRSFVSADSYCFVLVKSAYSLPSRKAGSVHFS